MSPQHENEYFSYYSKHLGDEEECYRHRSHALKRWSFVVPNSEALALVATFSPIVEIGAGLGYWAMLLRGLGADVVAYDNNSWPLYRNQRRWVEISTGNEESITAHEDRALMFCWPPGHDAMASRSLSLYNGNTVIYIGEAEGWSCADAPFFSILKDEFVLAVDFELPTWPRIHDRLQAFKKVI